MYVIRNSDHPTLAWDSDNHEWASMLHATIFTSTDEAIDAAELEETIPGIFVIARIA